MLACNSHKATDDHGERDGQPKSFLHPARASGYSLLSLTSRFAKLIRQVRETVAVPHFRLASRLAGGIKGAGAARDMPNHIGAAFKSDSFNLNSDACKCFVERSPQSIAYCQIADALAVSPTLADLQAISLFLDVAEARRLPIADKHKQRPMASLADDRSWLRGHRIGSFTRSTERLLRSRSIDKASEIHPMGQPQGITRAQQASRAITQLGPCGCPRC